MADESPPKDPRLVIELEPEAWLASKLYFELRKEILSTQSIRARVIGFKITFISAAVGLIVANINTVSPYALVMPAFSAIFFDYLICSYSFSIKRLGLFSRLFLERKLCTHFKWPEPDPLWEQYMDVPAVKQAFSRIGNLGITVVAMVPAAVVMFQPYDPPLTIPVCFALAALFGMDMYAHAKPQRLTKMKESLERKSFSKFKIPREVDDP